MSVAYQLICHPAICQHTDQHRQPICWLTCWPRDQPGFGWYVDRYGNRELADILVDMLIVYQPIVSTNTWLGVHKLYKIPNQLQPWRFETVIKDGFEARNGTWISIWNILSGKTGLPFQDFHCSLKFFCWNDPRSQLPLAFQLEMVNNLANGTFCKR